MKVALYARTSSHDDRQNPEIQLHELRAVANQRGWVIASEFVDTLSGAKAKRPGLDRMLTEIRKHKFDGIAVTRLDRLARNLSNLIQLVKSIQ